MSFEKFADINARYAEEERRQILLCARLRDALEEAEGSLAESSRGRNQNRDASAMLNLGSLEASNSRTRSRSPTLDKASAGLALMRSRRDSLTKEEQREMQRQIRQRYEEEPEANIYIGSNPQGQFDELERHMQGVGVQPVTQRSRLRTTVAA